MDNNYYIYIYIRLDNNTIFYVGKGKNNRFKVLNGRNEHFINIINKIPYKVKFLYTDLTEQQAFDLEVKTIYDLVFNQEYGIDIQGYIKPNEVKHLCNQTWGGEGCSGYNYTEEQKKAISERMSGENNYWFGKIRTEHSERMSGENNSMFGVHRYGELAPFHNQHHTEESKQKISETRIEKGLAKGENNPNSKKVIAIINDIPFAIFDYIKGGAEFFGINNGGITNCCKGRTKSSGKYNGKPIVWKQIEIIEL